MTEQYEQITDWNGFIAAHVEGSLYSEVCGEKFRCGSVDNIRLADLDVFIKRGSYYRKVEPEQVELVEWKYLLKGADEVFKYVRPTVKLDSDYWYRTGYIIKGVRVKA